MFNCYIGLFITVKTITLIHWHLYLFDIDVGVYGAAGGAAGYPFDIEQRPTFLTLVLFYQWRRLCRKQMCDCFLFSTFTLFSVIPFYFLYFPIFVRPWGKIQGFPHLDISCSWYFLRWDDTDSSGSLPDRTDLILHSL